MDDLKSIEEFFDTKTVENGHSIKSLDWGSKRTQEIRFYIFSELASLNGKSILDVGCGFADFFHFLNDKLKLNIDYTGIDISTEIVKKTKALYPYLNIQKKDILTQDVKKHDYVFASGIHNIKVQDNYKLLEKMLKRMFELTNFALATNFVNIAYKEPLAKHIFGYDIKKVRDIAKYITSFSTIRQDYLPNDFTLYLYRHDWATRSNYEEK